VFVLSACRLARVQAALTLCPATTGLRMVDCFINGALNEPAEAEAEYTERLILAPGSINRYDFAGEPWPGELSIPRSAFGVPEGAFLFASGANFYKLVPELLESWAEILRRVPDGRLVLYPFNPNWTNLYPRELFSRHVRGVFQRHGVDPWRVRLLMPLASRAHIQAVLRQADLYLDSFPYSGAVSMMDPIGAGCPVLLCEGRPARNRQSTGMFRDGGFAGVIAAGAGDYIEHAVRLAARPPELAGLRRQAAAMAAGAGAWSRLDLNGVLGELADSFGSDLIRLP
jgi:predicted O-linked N-acetylglucosamine transferase (SPINDLY family)